MTESPHRSATRTATSLVADVLSRVPELTDALVRTIEEQNPAYRRMKVVPTDDLWQSCHDNLVRVLQLVARTDDDAEAYDAARATGRLRARQRMPLDDVPGGGSFGRHLFHDVAAEAAEISKKMGKPVKLSWSRTDDFRQGRAHPMCVSRVRATYLLGQVLTFEQRHTSSATSFSHGL